jgi:hypothetical protein
MSRSHTLVLVVVIPTLGGLLGFFAGYAAERKSAVEAADMFAAVPGQTIAELAYAFAPPDQVREVIAREPRLPRQWAHAEPRVELLRKIRLAVVAESQIARDELLKQAETLCDSCKPETVHRLFERYAQSRMVPPGNDVTCESCSPDRRRKILRPMD